MSVLMSKNVIAYPAERVQVDDAYLGENRFVGPSLSWIGNKVPRGSPSLSMQAGAPRYIKIATCPRSLLPLLLWGPRSLGDRL